VMLSHRYSMPLPMLNHASVHGGRFRTIGRPLSPTLGNKFAAQSLRPGMAAKMAYLCVGMLFAFRYLQSQIVLSK
jgi:hypothetical protein